MADIFVSYARGDHARAKQLATVLSARGWTVWWDRELLAGDDYERAIQDALDHAHCVIVLWSAASTASAWVRNEANEALRRGVLVPLVVGDAKPPLAFRHLQTIAFDANASPDAASPAHDDLTRAVTAMLRRSPQSSTTAHADTGAAAPPLAAEAGEGAPASPSTQRSSAALAAGAALVVVITLIGGYLAFFGRSDWKSTITSGATVGVRFDTDRSLGTLHPRGLYFIRYRPEDGSWEGSGRQTTGAYLVDEGTRPSRSCDPEQEALCIWGMAFTFDNGGRVFVNGTGVGHLQPVTLRDKIKAGTPITVAFDTLSSDIGTIGKGMIYEVQFQPDTGVWSASGRKNTGEYQNYTDPQASSVCRPDDYNMCVWGAAFRFDDDGRVFEAEGRTSVGRVTELKK